MTNDVFLFDAVRTPRGRGRPGGGLHEVKPIDLVGTLLQALERRSNLDTERVDDIILGVVNPIGDVGSHYDQPAVQVPGGNKTGRAQMIWTSSSQ